MKLIKLMTTNELTLKSIFKLLYVCIIFIALASCESETINTLDNGSLKKEVMQISSNEASSGVLSVIEKLNFNEISNKFKLKSNNQFGFGNELQDSYAYIKSNEYDSYSILFKNENGVNNYHDNLIITENKNGIINSYIIRYKPVMEWYRRSDRSLLNFSGEIIRFNLNDNSSQTMTLIDGVQQKSSQKNSSGGCIRFEIFEIFEITTTQNGVVTTTYETEFVETVFDCSETPDGSGTNDDGSSGSIGGGNGSPDEDTLPLLPITSSVSYPFPHCSSWEYAMRGTIRGASVSGMSEMFVSAEAGMSGIDTGLVIVDFPVLYFTAPLGVTNGMAATMTAAAVYAAQVTTQNWYWQNTNASADQVSNMYWSELRSEMENIGGSVSTINSHDLRNPAPYVENFISTGNCM